MYVPFPCRRCVERAAKAVRLRSDVWQQLPHECGCEPVPHLDAVLADVGGLAEGLLVLRVQPSVVLAG